MTPFGPLVPAADSVVLIGAGRNANNLIGLFEGVGVAVAAILDDAPSGPVLGHSVQLIASGGAGGRAAIMTVGDPRVRQELDERSILRAAIWTTYVDPRSVVSPYARIEAGVFIAPFAACADVCIGRHASIMAGAVLGARVRVGAFSSVLPAATVASDATVGQGCVIGMGARVEAGVRIGDGCRVAPNAVVRRDMPDGSLASPRLATRVFRRGLAQAHDGLDRLDPE